MAKTRFLSSTWLTLGPISPCKHGVFLFGTASFVSWWYFLRFAFGNSVMMLCCFLLGAALRICIRDLLWTWFVFERDFRGWVTGCLDGLGFTTHAVPMTFSSFTELGPGSCGHFPPLSGRSCLKHTSYLVVTKNCCPRQWSCTIVRWWITTSSGFQQQANHFQVVLPSC